jgi:hypothetical protein
MESLSLLPLAYRVGSYLHEERRNGREPIFDLNGIGLEPPNPGPHAGVPCGGLVIICRCSELFTFMSKSITRNIDIKILELRTYH